MKRKIQLTFLLLASCLIVDAAFAQSMTDNEVRQQMIKESIRNYSGSCPCPYNTTKNGSSCGGRSAYSKPGGADPLCYEKDISDEMVKRYRERSGL